MKKLELGQSIQTLANIGVIAGIFFLAIQVNQTNEIALAETQAARYLFGIEAYRIVAENGDLAEVMVKDRANQDLSDPESLRLTVYWRGTFLTNQLAYRQLGEEGMADFVEILRANRTFPSFRRAWMTRGNTLDAEFARFMNDKVFTDTP